MSSTAAHYYYSPAPTYNEATKFDAVQDETPVPADGTECNQPWRRAFYILVLLIVAMIIINMILGLLFLIKAGHGGNDWNDYSSSSDSWSGGSSFNCLAKFIGAGLVLTTIGGVGIGGASIFSALIYQVALTFIRNQASSNSSSPFQRTKPEKYSKGTNAELEELSHKRPPKRSEKASLLVSDPIRLLWQVAIIGWSLTLIIGLIAIKVAVLLLIA